MDEIRPTYNRSTFRGILKNPAFLTATFGLAEITFALGGISAWVPTFLHRAERALRGERQPGGERDYRN